MFVFYLLPSAHNPFSTHSSPFMPLCFLFFVRSLLLTILTRSPRLQDGASSLLLLGGLFVIEDASDGVVEDLLQSTLGERGALDILESADLVGEALPPLEADGLLLLLSQLPNGLRVTAQIELCVVVFVERWLVGVVVGVGWGLARLENNLEVHVVATSFLSFAPWFRRG